jgi:3-oxoacyl-[acyl-carrier-protein] synthase-3
MLSAKARALTAPPDNTAADRRDTMYSRIAGTGSYLPEKVVSNFDLEKMMDTTDEWIRTRTGIERRHIAAAGQTTVDLAEVAARRAIEAAGVTPAEIDFIVFGTTTPDLVFPNCGTLLQARLGARGCPAFSVETACSGFIYAMSIADKFIKAGEAKCALVIGAETLSRITNWSDRNTAVLFGDGAGAVVLKPSSEPGVMSTHLHSDGSYKDLLYVESGVSTGFKVDPATNKVDVGIKMAGSEVFKVAVTKLGGAVDEALAANGLEKSAVNWLIPHQANIRIIGAMAKRLDLPMERVIVTVQDHGNTSTASVPLALDVGVRDGRVKRGDLLLLEAFGGGFTWGSALVRF